MFIYKNVCEKINPNEKMINEGKKKNKYLYDKNKMISMDISRAPPQSYNGKRNNLTGRKDSKGEG